MENELTGLPESEDIEMEWKQIEKSIIESLQSSVGQPKHRNNKDWFDDDCKKILDHRK